VYTAQKSNSHCAPQPYTNQCVFKSFCTSEILINIRPEMCPWKRNGKWT